MLFGGRVANFIDYWRQICHDRNILKIIKGVQIPFVNGKPPIQHNIPRELKMSHEEQQFVDVELDRLLKEGFIKQLSKPLPHGWISNIFLVPKKQGGFRMILNLKELNKYVQYTKFKMDNIDKVIQLLQPSDWMTSLDLNSAFGHLKVKDSDVRYFQFTWRGKFYCYVTLPQGFSDSPRLFTRCTSPIMSLLRKQLVDIPIYIDDTFLRSPTYNEMIANLAITRDIFQKCGLSINEEKSCMIPT